MSTKKTIAITVILFSAMIFGITCHQWNVILKDPSKYTGTLTVPTLLTQEDRQGTYSCDKVGALAGLSVWLRVVNPTEQKITPRIHCQYYLNGTYMDGFDRKIKPFDVGPNQYRRLLVDNSILVNNCIRYDVTVRCRMDLDTVTRKSNRIYPIKITLIPEDQQNEHVHKIINKSGGTSIKWLMCE